MAKQRDPVIDSMRGIGIVLMVLGHSGFPGTDFIYLFHMALFFMLSGWLFSLRGGPVHFIKRKAVTLWLPFVLANTAFTVLNNLFLKLNILTSDERILQVPGNAVTTPVTVKDVIGRTVHWYVFDGGTQLGGAMWFIQALFQVSILYALFCKGCCMVPIRCCRRDFFPACFCGWAGAAGWPDGTCGGWALRPAATACSTWARSCGARRGKAYRRTSAVFLLQRPLRCC